MPAALYLRVGDRGERRHRRATLLEHERSDAGGGARARVVLALGALVGEPLMSDESGEISNYGCEEIFDSKHTARAR